MGQNRPISAKRKSGTDMNVAWWLRSASGGRAYRHQQRLIQLNTLHSTLNLPQLNNPTTQLIESMKPNPAAPGRRHFQIVQRLNIDQGVRARRRPTQLS